MLTNKKLKPASLVAQKTWNKLPTSLKLKLGKTLPDTDKDSVPNGFDCRPKNRRKQESFLPADATYLNSGKELKLGKFINSGTEGSVYELAGNRNLVIKVPRGFKPSFEYRGASAIALDKQNRKGVTRFTKNSVQYEADTYTSQNFNDKPLFIPTMVVDVGSNDLDNGNYVGLIRPKILPIRDFHDNVKPLAKARITDKLLAEIREKLYKLTLDGYVFADELQIGVDRIGRPLIYDAGKMRKTGICDHTTFKTNNRAWLTFLRDIGKLESLYPEDVVKAVKKYGEIKMPDNYDTWGHTPC
jgi:hypothetical protein